MTQRSSGLADHAGSANRRSFAPGATAEPPPAMRANSAARPPARDATRPGWPASAQANLRADRPGKNRRAGPSAAWVSIMSRAPATSGASEAPLMTGPPFPAVRGR